MLIGDWRLVGFLNPRKCRQVLRLPEPSLKNQHAVSEIKSQTRPSRTSASACVQAESGIVSYVTGWLPGGVYNYFGWSSR